MAPLFSTCSEFVVNALSHAPDSFTCGTTAYLGLGLGGTLAAIAGIKLLRDSRITWVSVTGRLTGCSVEVVPALLFRTRKIIQVTYDYQYVADGHTHDGNQTVIETQDAYYDPRKRARESMARGEIKVSHDLRQPSRSCLQKPPRRRAKVDFLASPRAARSQLFYGFRLIASARVALFAGLSVILMSAAALWHGSPGAKSTGVGQISGTSTRHSSPGAAHEMNPGTTNLNRSSQHPRAATANSTSKSSLASRGR